MVNNKPTGPTFTRFLTIVLLGLGLTACSTTPEDSLAPEPEIITQPEPPATPAPVTIKRDYPDRYVVKKGDTLWDISKRFLKDPWLWPQVWHINPAIRNPHLIYPGDVIVLYYDKDGKPYITLEGAAGVRPSVAPLAPPKGIKTVKLSPRIRYESIDKAIATIPRSAIEPFLRRPRVVTEDELDDAPYVVSSFEEHLISGTGNVIYARDVSNEKIGAYDVVRPGEVYKDPDSGSVLGYEVIKLADARVTRGESGDDDITTLAISRAYQEVLNGDRLLPNEERDLDFNFFPRAPEKEINGRIISVFNGLSQIGQYNVVVLNRGDDAGLKPGHVLAIYQKGAKVRDPRSVFGSEVDLPDERAGILMVFRTYEEVSYALVMEAYRSLHVNDRVTNP